MKKINILTFLLFLSLSSFAKEKDPERGKIGSILKTPVLMIGKFDVNRISADVYNTGEYVTYHRTGDSGLEWPKGSGKTADFAAGIWFGGKLRQTGEVVTAIAEYRSDFLPGKIKPDGQPDDPMSSRYKIWKITRDDLINPGEDYLNWPVEDGAPWLDVDRDGEFTRGVDRPLLLGDQTLWMVFNDLAPGSHIITKGVTMGLEVQMTIWGFSNFAPLLDIMFVKFLAINKSNNFYDSTFIGLWNDPDIGFAGDDLVGYDTTLNLGYGWSYSSSDLVYGDKPPAIGRLLLQGPRVYTGDENDSALFLGKWVKGYKNLSVYAFPLMYKSGPYPYRDPEEVIEFYQKLKGVNFDSSQFVDPTTGQVTRYCFTGDPETGSGWLDGTQIIARYPDGSERPMRLGPADRRMLMSLGPFTFSPGDTQEVIFAVVIAQGLNNKNSVTKLKKLCKILANWHKSDYTRKLLSGEIETTLNVRSMEYDRKVGIYLERNRDIENFVLGDYKFEGYVLYQFNSATQPTDYRIIGVYDLKNGLNKFIASNFNPIRGAWDYETTVINGSDSGIKRFTLISKDYFTDLPLANGRTYHYCISAFAYNPGENGAKFMEIARKIISLTPKPPSFGMKYEILAGDTVKAEHISGSSEGKVFGIVVNPNELTGHRYQVRFENVNDEMLWSLIDLDENKVKLSGQRNQTGNGDYPVVDGIQFVVVGPSPGIKGYGLPWPAPNIITAVGAGIDKYFNIPQDFITYGGAIAYASPYGLFVSGRFHSDRISPYMLKNIKVVFASTDVNGNPLHYEDASFGYRYMMNADKEPAKPEFAGFIKNPSPGFAYQEFGLNGQKNVPLAVYDVDSDPPRRLAVGFLENNVPNGLVDGKYWPSKYEDLIRAGTDNSIDSGPREWLFIFDVDYSETENPELAKDILNNDLPVMYIAAWNRAGEYLRVGAFYLYVNHPNSERDVFEISAPSPPMYDISTAKKSLEKISVYPNPYYGASILEKTMFESFVVFTNLPRRCTIRIFTVAGDLIRKIEKDDDSPFLRWDLRNDAGIPVASGIYIAYISVPDIGEKILKIVIFQREERLRFY